MATTVSLRDVVDALETASDEMSSFVNRKTGEVITFTHEDLGLAEEEPLPDMPDWQREVVAAARQVLESSGDWRAFRNFKSTIRRLGVETAWFEYKRRELEDLARAWLAENDLEPSR